MKSASIDTINADGLRAVCDTSGTLPDLCHHAEYRIYVDGQYVESVGNLGPNVERALSFYRRRHREAVVEARALRCTMPNCEYRQRNIIATATEGSESQ